MENKVINEIVETNGSKLKFVNKRVDIVQKNITKLKILAPLFEDEAGSARESDIHSYIINKAIEYFYKSDDVKKRLENV